jgi:PIN domain nuclease of toxin-antitoxin system
MNLLLDTHLLLWASGLTGKLPAAAQPLLEDSGNTLCFSPISLLEIAIKAAQGRSDFQVEPRLLYRGLIDSGYVELPVTSEHTLNVLSLPPLHKDPFDRLLIAQATVEGFLLVTTDKAVAVYPGPIRKV